MDQTKLEAGLDEAGAGPLCGPVYAAAVIWPNDPDYFESFPEFEQDNIAENRMYQLLTEKGDSKKLTEKQRNELRDFIEQYSISWSVASCSAKEIDQMNILNARIKAMHRALEGLDMTPDSLLVDGNRFKQYIDPVSKKKIPCTLIENGDALYTSIAAASILAKTHRDEYMDSLHKKYPEYSWDTNKGYGTVKHYSALKKLGPTPEHRMSFNLHLDTL